MNAISRYIVGTMFKTDNNRMSLCIRYHISQSLHLLNDSIDLNIVEVDVL